MAQNWSFWRSILDAETQSSDDSTKIVKLSMSNYLHTLLVKVKITNGATSAKSLSVDDVVDKIEVIANGSDVIYSLTPLEIRRWALWMTGVNVPSKRDENGGAVQECVYPVHFGRWQFDPDFFLPCARFSDLELRVKYSPTIAATAFATGSTVISVMGLYTMSQPPSDYRGTLCTKLVRSFTSAASGDDQTLLPRGNFLRQLMVYAYEPGVDDGTNISRVKFDLNNDERVPYNLPWNDVSDLNKYENWVQHIESIRAFCKDADTIDTRVARIRSVNLSENFAGVLATDDLFHRRVTSIVGDRLTIEGMKSHITAGAEDLTADAVDRAVMLNVVGGGLSNAVVLNFSYLGEMALLNSAEFDQVRLTLTQGGAGGDVRISVQELRAL